MYSSKVPRLLHYSDHNYQKEGRSQGKYGSAHNPMATHTPEIFLSHRSEPQNLPSPDCWTRECVGSWLFWSQNWASSHSKSTYDRVVNVDQNSRVCCRVCARECNQRTWSTTSSAGNSNLSTGDVKLCSTSTLGDMQTNVFNSDEIVATRSSFGNSERDLFGIYEEHGSA